MVLSLYDLEHEDIRMILFHEVLGHLAVGKEGNIRAAFPVSPLEVFSGGNNWKTAGVILSKETFGSLRGAMPERGAAAKAYPSDTAGK